MPFVSLPENRRFGCVAVKHGAEAHFAKTINDMEPSVVAREVMQLKHKSKAGKKQTEPAPLLPGYVMFEADKDYAVSRLYQYSGIYRILREEDGDWYLHGSDEAFARWVFDYDGVIGVSKLYREGDEIRIISGPLKDCEGRIIRIDKRNRNGLVQLGFDGKPFQAWLAFDWMDDRAK